MVTHSPTLFLPGESHGRRSLGGYSPQGRKESDMTVTTWHTHVQYSLLHCRWSVVTVGPPPLTPRAPTLHSALGLIPDVVRSIGFDK